MGGARATRRAVIAGVPAVALCAGGYQWYRHDHQSPRLLSETVAFDAGGIRREIQRAQLDRLRAHSRCLIDAPTKIIADEADWRHQLAPWTSDGEFQDLLDAALLDLWVLSYDLAAPIAGWSKPWRYVWPRDAAHAIVALALAGDHDSARRALTFLSSVQDATGWFRPRYDPVDRRPPDDRPRQLDASAWPVWATTTLAAIAPGELGELHSTAGDLVARSTTLLSSSLGADDLPPVTPDYWETPEKRLSLGTAAAVRLGLSAANRLAPSWADTHLESSVGDAAVRLDQAMTKAFAAQGWPRHTDEKSIDASVCFLTEPYAAPPADLGDALDRYRRDAARPAGGVAPGTGWKQDGISWTPETMLLAQAYAFAGRDDETRDLLGWVDRHRTRAGSLPEKVNHDGSPSAVAPLAWTAALVVTTVARLRGAYPTTAA